MLSNLKIILVFTFIVILISCSGNNKKVEAPKTVEFNLTANDEMQYNLKTMVANEGDLIKIHFQNTGKMSIDKMGHNLIVINPNVDLASFVAKANESKEHQYIPVDYAYDIIAYSKLLGPGEKTLIEFTAPKKGNYKFICSFPGHYSTMQGNLVVK